MRSNARKTKKLTLTAKATTLTAKVTSEKSEPPDPRARVCKSACTSRRSFPPRGLKIRSEQAQQRCTDILDAWGVGS